MTFPDRLQMARERLSIAITPDERAARAGRAPGGTLDQALGRTAIPAPAPMAPGLTAPEVAPRAAPAADPYAGEAPGFVPAGMQRNPEATNFGRLAQERTDVPRFVPQGAAAPGIDPGEAARRASPGIDVRSYAGSMWTGTATGPGAPQALAAAGRAQPPAGGPPALRDPQGMPLGASRTMLPVGNPTARDAMLRSQFPNANRAELSALGNMAWNRPEEFNSAMAGTRLDPVAKTMREEQGLAQIAADRVRQARDLQTMKWGEEDRPAELAAKRLQLAGANQDLGIKAEDAARRARDEQRTETIGYPTAEAAARAIPKGQQGQVTQTRDGRYVVQFQTAQPDRPSETELDKLIRGRDTARSPEDRAHYERAIQNFRGDKQERPLTLNEFYAADSIAKRFGDDYGLYRENYSKQIGKMPAAAPAGAPAASAPVPAKSSKYEVGKIYTDANGNKAQWDGSKWVEL